MLNKNTMKKLRFNEGNLGTMVKNTMKKNLRFNDRNLGIDNILNCDSTLHM